MAKKRSRKRKKKDETDPKDIIIFALIIGLLGISTLYVGDYLGFWTILPVPEVIDDGNGGGGNGGETPISKFYYEYESINENYSLEIDVRVNEEAGHFIFELTDKSIEISYFYIFLDGHVTENGINVHTLTTGESIFDRIHDDDVTYQYSVFMTFFDTILGTTVQINENLNDFNVIQGNSSDYIQLPLNRGNITKGSSDFQFESVPNDNTMLLYHFNESTEPIVIDSSFYNRTGTQVDDVIQGETGKWDTDCFNFNSTEYIRIDDTFNFTDNLVIVDYWIYKDIIPTPILFLDEYEYIYGKNETIGTGIYYDAGLLSTDYYLTFSLFDSSDTEYRLDASWNPISDRWYHVQNIYNGSHQSIYLDGIEVGTSNIGSFTIKEANYNHTIAVWNTDLKFDGRIDEFKILNTTFSEDGFIYECACDYIDNITKNLYSNSSQVELLVYFETEGIVDNITQFSIETNYTVDDNVSLTQEKLEVWNWTSSSFVEYNISSNIIPENNMINSSGTILIQLNFTGNVTNYTLYLDQLVSFIYYPTNETDLNWSAYSDNTCLTLFMNETTNQTSFITEFNISDPVANLFNSKTVYEFSISEGEIGVDIDFQPYLYNYTSASWIDATSLITITELSYQEYLITINNIPIPYFDDIVNNNNSSQKITFQFNFSSPSAKIFMDYIQKTTYFMDTTDNLTIAHDFRIQFFECASD